NSLGSSPTLSSARPFGTQIPQTSSSHGEERKPRTNASTASAATAAIAAVSTTTPRRDDAARDRVPGAAANARHLVEDAPARPTAQTAATAAESATAPFGAPPMNAKVAAVPTSPAPARNAMPAYEAQQRRLLPRNDPARTQYPAARKSALSAPTPA